MSVPHLFSGSQTRLWTICIVTSNKQLFFAGQVPMLGKTEAYIDLKPWNLPCEIWRRRASYTAHADSIIHVSNLPSFVAWYDLDHEETTFIVCIK